MNTEILKQQLNSLQRGNSHQNLLWKPEPGQSIIRIVPYKECLDSPFVMMYFHYGVGDKKVLLSLKTFNEVDPIDTFVNQHLKTSPDPNLNEVGKQIESKQRIYLPILVRGKESEGVKWWGFGQQIAAELLDYMCDPEYGDLTDVQKGRDITITVKSPKETGKQYGQTTLKIKPSTTPVSDDPKIIALIKAQQDIKTVFKKYTSDELEGILKNWLEPDKAAKEVTPLQVQSSPEPNNNSTNIAAAAKTPNLNDIDASFDDLFKD